MKPAYFITGTDTNAGKTWATAALMEAFKARGKTVAGMKPVASGCQWLDGKLRNADALMLQRHANVPLDYDRVNPYAYEAPISPHLAGRDHPADLGAVKFRFEEIKKLADIVLVEGAGGWYSPVNASQDNSDLARALDLPVILAVGMRLGCINHARLSAEAIIGKGLKLAGWIAVCNDPAMTCVEANIDSLRSKLNAPLLGVMPHRPEADPASLHPFLSLERL